MSRVAISVSITPQLEKFIDEEVASGRYGTVSEVVRAGLRILQERVGREKSAIQDSSVRKRHAT